MCTITLADGDVGGALEGVGDDGIDVDEHVSLARDLCVPLVDPLLDPVGEGLAQVGVDEVDQELLREVSDLLLDGEVDAKRGLLRARPVEDLLSAERLVLRAGEVNDVRALHGPPRAGDDVLEEVDGDRVAGGQVVLALHGEEEVHLWKMKGQGEGETLTSLALELGSERGRGDLLHLLLGNHVVGHGCAGGS